MTLVDEHQTVTTVPIQGTFDIAKARHVVRTAVNLKRWPITFNARVGAALTALGEIIIMASAGGGVSVRIEVLDQGARQGISLQCSLAVTAANLPDLQDRQKRLSAAVDELKVQRRAGLLEITVLLYL